MPGSQTYIHQLLLLVICITANIMNSQSLVKEEPWNICFCNSQTAVLEMKVAESS